VIRFAIFFLALLAGAAPAFAVTNWIAEQTPETITWEGTEGNGNRFSGRCTAFIADIAFDAEALDASSVTVVIDMMSCLTGEKQKDEYLPAEGWFNVADYPKAVFEAKTFRHDGGNRYLAEGTLTLRGNTHPVTLPFALDIDGGKAHVTGETVLNRLDFGVGAGQLASPDVAAQEVTVRIDLTATKS
jgi:polyisoprenoid-binding protein YceI